jgi:hypothetical protein
MGITRNSRNLNHHAESAMSYKALPASSGHRDGYLEREPKTAMSALSLARIPSQLAVTQRDKRESRRFSARPFSTARTDEKLSGYELAFLVPFTLRIQPQARQLALHDSFYRPSPQRPTLFLAIATEK